MRGGLYEGFYKNMSRFTDIDRESLLDNATRKSLGRVQKLEGANPTFLSILNVESDDEQGEMVTVYLQVQNDNSQDVLAPDAKFKPYIVAKVEWGNGGYRTAALIDVVDGQAFSLTCASLRVTVGPDSQFFVGVPFFDTPMVVGAHLSYGTRPAQALSPTRTIRVPTGAGTLAAGGTSATFAIPLFSRSLLVVSNPEANPVDADLIQIMDGTGTVIYQRHLNIATGIQLPIALDARFFKITNNGAAVKVYRFIFELTF